MSNIWKSIPEKYSKEEAILCNDWPEVKASISQLRLLAENQNHFQIRFTYKYTSIYEIQNFGRNHKKTKKGKYDHSGKSNFLVLIEQFFPNFRMLTTEKQKHLKQAF